VSQAEAILGVHIDDQALSIVHLVCGEPGMEVAHWARIPLEPGIVGGGLIEQPQEIAALLGQFRKTHKIKCRTYTVVLACSAVRIHVSRMALASEEKFQDHVTEQIAKYNLFGHEETQADFCVLKKGSTHSDLQTLAQAITTRQLSDRNVEAIHLARGTLSNLQPALLPALRCLASELLETETSLLLLVDGSGMMVCVLDGQFPCYCKNLAISSRQLIDDKACGDPLREQLAPVIEYAHSLHKGSALTLRVLASCDYDDLRTLIIRIRDSIRDVKVKQVCVSQITRHYHIEQEQSKDLPVFALSSALAALQEPGLEGQLNLIAPEAITQHQISKQLSWTGRAIIALVLLSVLAVFPINQRVKGLTAASVTLQNGVQQIEKSRVQIDRVKEQLASLRQKESTYRHAHNTMSKIPYVTGLQIIGQTVPDRVRILDIGTKEEDKIVVVGRARSERHVHDFSRKLSRTPIFKTAKPDHIEFDEESGVVEFSLVCVFNSLTQEAAP